MPRSRPASNPISYHKYTNQYYVTRGGKRIYLGCDKEEALKKYYHLGLGFDFTPEPETKIVDITIKDLANRFITAQQANWQNPNLTMKSYKQWLGRFLQDHPKLRLQEFSVEMFAKWKLSLKKREYASETINHYLSSVRAMFSFAEDVELIGKAPKLKRVKNEVIHKAGSNEKPLYTKSDLISLLHHADIQLTTMILLALNCGFGPKDVHDLLWSNIEGDKVTLPRSKTGVSQTYTLWAETKESLNILKIERARLVTRLNKGKDRSDKGHIFITRYWKPWSKDAVAGQFRKLCAKAKIPCYGFYRLRHCASTAMSLVANPHIHRQFLRHSQLQQQVTYTHIPNNELDIAVLQAKEKLLGSDVST